MPASGPDAFNHALHTANIWLSDVSGAFDTRNRRFSHRVLRAYLHTLRDRLTVAAAVKFGQQLPELLRGVYYDGWEPSRVPVRYRTQAYLARFGGEAGLAPDQAAGAASTITGVLANRMSAGQLAETLAELPAELRVTLTDGVAVARSGTAHSRTPARTKAGSPKNSTVSPGRNHAR